MKWKKQGLIYKTDKLSWWQSSHTYCPTPLLLDDRIRIYVTFWDPDKRGRPGYIDVEIDNPKKIIDISGVPCLPLGDRGCFDEDGRTCTSVRWEPHAMFYQMLYIGWQRQVNVPYSLFTGTATSEEGRLFRAPAKIPWLDRTSRAPFTRSGASYVVGDDVLFPHVAYLESNKWIWSVEYQRYWFDSSIALLDTNLDKHIDIVLPRRDGEWCFGRPWIIRKQGKLHMWYVYRKDTEPGHYIQGYAIANDTLEHHPESISFERFIEPPIPLGKAGEFDSESASHATVLEVAPNKYYMFYMGNEFGKEGFGWAEARSLG